MTPKPKRSIIEDDQPGLLRRAEVVVWSVLARFLLKSTSLQTALRILDRAPSISANATSHVTIPTEWFFGRAGTCLGRQIARSQYLRSRGAQSTIVIGAKLQENSHSNQPEIDAHAWLEPLDATSPHPILHRVTR